MTEKENKTDKEKQRDIAHLTLSTKRKRSEKISFSYNLGVYWSLMKPYLPIVGALLVIMLIIESIAIGERFLFKIITDNGTAYSAGTISYASFIQILWIILAIFIVMIAFKFVGRWLSIHLTNKLEGDLIVNLKRKYFNHIIGLSHGFHTNHKTGSLIARLTRGGRATEVLTDIIIFNFTPLIFQFIIAGTAIAFYDPKTALALSGVIVIFISYSLWIQKIQQNANLKANEAEDIEKGNISNFFTNVDSIRYFGKEYSIKERFAKISENTRRAMVKHWNYFRWLDSGQAIITSLGSFVVIALPLMNFFSGEISLGTVVFTYTVYLGIAGPMFGFVHGIRDFYRVMADFEDLFQYGRIENEIKDKKNAEYCSIKEGNLEFKDVDFSYGKRKIFSDLNLKVNKNEKVALVGHSGSGKTTLVKLLFRFYDLESGSILIDNKDIRDFKQESLRGELSVVPQEGILFDDTIYNNIAFSNPKATREQVFAAIKFAQLDDFIKKLPNKENTIVGERGVKLSGGEKQRVSIARAILANKKILVLDEATSSLDSKTEYQIQKDLQRLMQNRTTIIIAHRLSTIMSADKIIVMNKGKIVQIGKHNELIRKPGLYKELWTLQKGGYLGE
jgi:ATP-binding cassette subfamily B protein